MLDCMWVSQSNNNRNAVRSKINTHKSCMSHSASYIAYIYKICLSTSLYILLVLYMHWQWIGCGEDGSKWEWREVGGGGGTEVR